MITVYLNRRIGDDERRESLFAGDFYLYSGIAGADVLADHAKT